MREIFEDLQTLTDDIVRLLAFDVDHKADAAGIFLLPRVVEPLLPWKTWKFHVTYLVKKAGLFSCWVEALTRGLRDAGTSLLVRHDPIVNSCVRLMEG
jgi:hypothetical protein